MRRFGFGIVLLATTGLTTLGLYVRAGSNGVTSAATETPYPVRTIYALDGLEHPTNVASNPPVTSERGVSVMHSRTEESLTRAVWVGRQVVVMTYDKERVTRQGSQPYEVVLRHTTRHVLSRAEDGTLVWETIVLRDVLPGTSTVTAPLTIRRVFRRVSS
jgi:hypothetical protein